MDLVTRYSLHEIPVTLRFLVHGGITCHEHKWPHHALTVKIMTISHALLEQAHLCM